MNSHKHTHIHLHDTAMRSGARVLEVDFNYKQSLLEAMTGVRCVFLHTHYWEMYSRTLEVWHVSLHSA